MKESNTLVAYSRMTQKGQITIPKALREAAGLKIHHQVTIKLEKGKVLNLEKTPLLSDLAGKFTAPPGKNALDARKYMEEHYYDA